MEGGKEKEKGQPVSHGSHGGVSGGAGIPRCFPMSSPGVEGRAAVNRSARCKETWPICRPPFYRRGLHCCPPLTRPQKRRRGDPAGPNRMALVPPAGPPFGPTAPGHMWWPPPRKVSVSYGPGRYRVNIHIPPSLNQHHASLDLRSKDPGRMYLHTNKHFNSD